MKKIQRIYLKFGLGSFDVKFPQSFFSDLLGKKYKGIPLKFDLSSFYKEIPWKFFSFISLCFLFVSFFSFIRVLARAQHVQD